MIKLLKKYYLAIRVPLVSFLATTLVLLLFLALATAIVMKSILSLSLAMVLFGVMLWVDELI